MIRRTTDDRTRPTTGAATDRPTSTSTTSTAVTAVTVVAAVEVVTEAEVVMAVEVVMAAEVAAVATSSGRRPSRFNCARSSIAPSGRTFSI